MANRAYLYPHPHPAFGKFDSGRPERYYDSRHTIPVGWFFFFSRPDIILVGVQDWQEVKLAAPKAPALDLFRSRRPFLDCYLLGKANVDAAATLVADLVRWPGEYLLLDPHEVVDFDDLRHKSQFELVCESLESGEPERLDAAIRPYCGRLSDDPETRVGQVLGHTYAWE